MLALLLSIALTPEQPAFPEPVTVQIRISNNSTADVTIPRIGQWCGYAFNVIDAATHETLPSRQCKTIGGVAPVTIRAGSVFAMALPLSDFVSIMEPGTYSVQASIFSRVTVRSNVVTLPYGSPL